MQIFHPALHPLFESLAYLGGYAVYRRERSHQGDTLDDSQRWIVIAAAAVGALLGSHLLGVLEQWPRLSASGISLPRAFLLPGGKTIVGGLLGGWLLVECTKHVKGIRSRTGDLFAVPLAVGIAIGRIGCFLAGVADDTYGKPTRLPWGIDFGDGIRRQPTQLYEIIFLLALAYCCRRLLLRRPHKQGSVFRVFLAAYLAFRLVIDFFKPQPLVGGLNLIQWACVCGLAALAFVSIKPEQTPLGDTVHG
jgi:phosphatidylglycerol---prolipoprotein diacylglyceryl transferase